MVNLDTVKELILQRGFEEYKYGQHYLIGKRVDSEEYIYIKIFDDKLELNVVREFLSSKFTITNNDMFTKHKNLRVVQLIIICKSFQNSHLKEFKELSNRVQLIKTDFFNINVTKKSPPHTKVCDEETLAILKKIKKNLPLLKEEDPNCVFYNFRKGDIIRVLRSNGDICHRLVK